ncbi:MAG: hypothetical protein AAB531_03660 [Patescibacteria group bacterium]
MNTLTISLPSQIAKKVDFETKKQGFATRSEFVGSLLKRYFTQKDLVFQEFKPQALNKIKNDFEKTGRYNKKFVDSMIKGLSASSAYARKTTSS